jgi:hypothetical protein
MGTTAIDELRAGFEEPFDALGREPERDRDAVVISWPSVPVEIVRAARLRPVVARGGPEPTPAASAVLEPDLFPSRLRRLVEAASTGRLAHAAAIVLPRTSDADYKCFLYLRELVRRGRVGALPPVLLFDLLQSASDGVRAHDAARTGELLDTLSGIASHRAAPDDLRIAIRAANAARAAARRLDALRHGEPRLTGREAIALLGAFWQIAPERYAPLADEAAETIGARPPLRGPRVLIAGAPVDSADLHAEIEARGAVVVAELSPFGSEAAGDDVEPLADRIDAIADRYRRCSVDARLPVALLERRIGAAVARADAVVVSLPPDDAAFGWDYPRLRALLEGRALPHAVLRGDPALPMAEADRGRIDALLARAEARHG